jgi:hypothetical protein
MYQEQIFREPLNLEQFKGPSTLREMLRACDCGRMTFLELPCGYCGKTPSRPGYGLWKKRYQKFLFTGCALSVGAPLVAAVLAGVFLHPAVCVILALAAIGAVVLDLRAVLNLVQKQEAMETFWLVHESSDLKQGKGGFRKVQPRRIVESRSVEPMIDAYYQDLDRLEALADRGQWQQVLEQADRLSYVYSNPRLSRVQLRAILNLPINEETALDLNQICSHLTLSDVEDYQVWKLLHQLGDYLLRGECLENDQIKRLFRQVLYRLLELRRFTQPPRPVEEGAGYHRLMSLCGKEPFEKVWGKLTYNEYGMLTPSPDPDTYSPLCAELARLERKWHTVFLSSGSWMELLTALKACPEEHLQRLAAFVERRYCYDRRTGETSILYEATLKGQLRQIDAIDLLLPEEKWYVNQVLNCCVYDENGQLYSQSAPIIQQLMCAGDDFLREAQEGQWAGKQTGEIQEDPTFDEAPVPQPAPQPEEENPGGFEALLGGMEEEPEPNPVEPDPNPAATAPAPQPEPPAPTVPAPDPAPAPAADDFEAALNALFDGMEEDE